MPRIVAVARSSEIPAGEARVVQVGEREIAVFNLDGTFRAFENSCPHRGAPLGDGIAKENKVICLTHGWAFDADSGQATHDPEMRAICYPVTVEGGEVRIEVPDEP
jgi:nitrite reductase (NADH) small subunit/3-phenylpropionate/trans-cinnamate dioxygenase ferredoxin subunit